MAERACYQLASSAETGRCTRTSLTASVPTRRCFKFRRRKALARPTTAPSSTGPWGTNPSPAAEGVYIVPAPRRARSASIVTHTHHMYRLRHTSGRSAFTLESLIKHPPERRACHRVHTTSGDGFLREDCEGTTYLGDEHGRGCFTLHSRSSCSRPGQEGTTCAGEDEGGGGSGGGAAQEETGEDDPVRGHYVHSRAAPQEDSPLYNSLTPSHPAPTRSSPIPIHSPGSSPRLTFIHSLPHHGP